MARRPSNRKTVVLLIDHPEQDLALTREFLAREGFEVLEARSAADGLRLAETGRPDIILVDFALPDGPGGELCRRLKRGATTGGVPVLLRMAELPGAQLGSILKESGADGFVTGQGVPTELVATIRAALARR